MERPPDSPSKRVSFVDVGGQENGERGERQPTVYELRERERNNGEYVRRRQLRERLEKAKRRATQLRAIQSEQSARPLHNLINIR